LQPEAPSGYLLYYGDILRLFVVADRRPFRHATTEVQALRRTQEWQIY
jgi:hypothetical protein